MQLFNESQARSLRLLEADLVIFSAKSRLREKIFFFTQWQKCEQYTTDFNRFVVFFT